ncbi:nitrile hydratase subunit beta [archaeon]|nr:MAG: nitrile hydratase subunit beta [archaeon]
MRALDHAFSFLLFFYLSIVFQLNRPLTVEDMNSSVGSNGVHDLGGICLPDLDGNGTIDLSEKVLQQWELQTHALLVILSTKSPRLASTDELRRAVEALEPKVYRNWSYYGKWAAGLLNLMVERGVVTENEVQNALSGDERKKAHDVPLFKVGDQVSVRPESTRVRWKRPHLRVPGYIFEQAGEVVAHIGEFSDPSFLAFRAEAPKQALYIVKFQLGSVFPSASYSADSIEVEVYEDWLQERHAGQKRPLAHTAPDHDHEYGHEHKHGHNHHDNREHEHEHEHEHHALQGHSHRSHQHEHHEHHEHEHHEHGAHEEGGSSCCAPDPCPHHIHADEFHEHQHEHEHGHTHDDRAQVEQRAVDKEGETGVDQVVAGVLLGLLLHKGVTTYDEVHSTVERLEKGHARVLGADLVVRAWKDPAFKQRLIADASAAALELGIQTSNPNARTVLRVNANSPTQHHCIVCTLCSCYPQALLGFSPAWYKSRNYRARMVREPRAVLREFGLQLPEHKQVIVHDSTADCRYMVLPEPPAHLLAEDIQRLPEEELRRMVTRDSMLGVAVL